LEVAFRSQCSFFLSDLRIPQQQWASCLADPRGREIPCNVIGHFCSNGGASHIFKRSASILRIRTVVPGKPKIFHEHTYPKILLARRALAYPKEQRVVVVSLLRTSIAKHNLKMWKSDASRWAAVKNRDPTADGYFVYAVRTTKVYCRPVCKARLARRANVSFFALPEDAAKAGFRPCKRCKPDARGEMPEERAVQKIRALIREEPGCSPSPSSLPLTPRDTGSTNTPEPDPGRLADLARQTGISKWHFHRVFKNVAGVTPAEFLRQRRRTDQGLGTVSPMGLDWSFLEDCAGFQSDLLDGEIATSDLDFTFTNFDSIFSAEGGLAPDEHWWNCLTEKAAHSGLEAGQMHQ
jgi:methylphosphotriester-DNA--protein-cysteine methyltransferase